MKKKKKFQHPIVSALQQGTEIQLLNGKTATVAYVDDSNDSFYPSIAINIAGTAGRIRDYVFPNHIKGVVK